MSLNLRRELRIEPAYDKRDPDPKKNYGIHGVTLRFYLIGEAGAIQFAIFTNWQLPHVTEEALARPIRDALDIKVRFLPMAADIGRHSLVPKYDGEQPMSQECDLLHGPCYYDGSSLQAETVFRIMVERGDEGMWAEMGRYYRAWLLDEEGVWEEAETTATGTPSERQESP